MAIRVVPPSFPTLSDAFEACRLAIRHGDLRFFGCMTRLNREVACGDGEETIVLVLDEGHQQIVDATLSTVDEFREVWGQRSSTTGLNSGLNIVMTPRPSRSSPKKFVIDTMEVTVPWSKLDAVYEAVRDAAFRPARSLCFCPSFAQLSRWSLPVFQPCVTATSRHAASKWRDPPNLWDESQRAALRTERTCRTTMVLV